MPTTEQFAGLCYLVLMDHHGGGYRHAHPSYIEEKLHLLQRGYSAYAALDRYNQLHVLRYLDEWKLRIPEPIMDYERHLVLYLEQDASRT